MFCADRGIDLFLFMVDAIRKRYTINKHFPNKNSPVSRVFAFYRGFNE